MRSDLVVVGVDPVFFCIDECSARRVRSLFISNVSGEAVFFELRYYRNFDSRSLFSGFLEVGKTFPFVLNNVGFNLEPGDFLGGSASSADSVHVVCSYDLEDGCESVDVDCACYSWDCVESRCGIVLVGCPDPSDPCVEAGNCCSFLGLFDTNDCAGHFCSSSSSGGGPEDCKYRNGSAICINDYFEDGYIPNPDLSQCDCICGLDYGYVTCEEIGWPEGFVRDPSACTCSAPLCLLEGEFFIDNPELDPPCICALENGYTCQDYGYPANWGQSLYWTCSCDCLVTNETCAQQNPNYITGFDKGYFNCNCECSLSSPHNVPCPPGYIYSGNPDSCDCVPVSSSSSSEESSSSSSIKLNCVVQTVTLDPNQITFIDLLYIPPGKVITITHSGCTTDNNIPGTPCLPSPAWLEMQVPPNLVGGWLKARHTSDDGDKLPSSYGNNGGEHIIHVEMCDP